jgi:maltooligosyltrehalose trehalohydrolase
VLLTHEQRGYYARFGGVAQFASVWRPGLAATGAGSGKGSCGKRAQRVGSPARPFVVFSQNHDQVGNRPCGERLSALASFEAQKLAAATVLLSPFIPLLFMGEEYGETAPFPYFVSHSHLSLVRAVRDGRRTELAAFGWRGKPLNPQEQTSFERAKLTSRLAERSPHRLLREFYRELIRLRRTVPALAAAGECTIRVRAFGPQEVLLVHYSIEGGRVLAAFNYSARFARVTATTPPGRWSTLLDSASLQWKGPGNAVAGELVSRDSLKLTLPAKSVLVLESRGRDGRDLGGVVRL